MRRSGSATFCAASRHARTSASSSSYRSRSEEHTSELQSLRHLVCRLLLRRAPRSTPFPYTTLFRSRSHGSTLRHGTTMLTSRGIRVTRPGSYWNRTRRRWLCVVRAPRHFARRHDMLEPVPRVPRTDPDRKSTRLNSSHLGISYAVFCFAAHRALHPFPTRRSSDLGATARRCDTARQC